MTNKTQTPPAPYPTYDDIINKSMEIAKGNSNIVTYEEMGKSAKGRPIPLMTITDSSVPLEEKRVFLMSGGTDGDEEVGRAIALAFAEELCDNKYAERLKKHHVLVVPVTNPDGTFYNIKDSLGNGNGIGANKVHLQGKEPATEEGKVMRQLVEEFIPDAHIDYHGLAGGSMGDTSYLYPTINSKFSISTLYEVNRIIEDAASQKGFPQQGTPRLWWEARNNLPGWLARNYSTLSMVMEGTENYNPIEDSQSSGVIRLLKLMDIAEEKEFYQDFPNYPCDLISGSKMGALMSSGDDYSARRKSRRDCSQMILEGVPWFGRIENDYDWNAIIELPINDDVKTLPDTLSFKLLLDKRAEIKNVLWQDHNLEDNLWSIEETVEGKIVRAKVPEAPKIGKNFLKVQYDSPFKRHVQPSNNRTF
ncbi:MAG: hypothetical protein COA79_19990 [Planctomycetota bacterium]|nr:MAG: hypothetical protein COA79_19990 [Planctomycetota bacterium]